MNSILLWNYKYNSFFSFLEPNLDKNMIPTNQTQVNLNNNLARDKQVKQNNFPFRQKESGRTMCAWMYRYTQVRNSMRCDIVPSRPIKFSYERNKWREGIWEEGRHKMKTVYKSRLNSVRQHFLHYISTLLLLFHLLLSHFSWSWTCSLSFSSKVMKKQSGFIFCEIENVWFMGQLEAKMLHLTTGNCTSLILTLFIHCSITFLFKSTQPTQISTFIFFPSLCVRVKGNGIFVFCVPFL